MSSPVLPRAEEGETEEDALSRAREERAIIVRKYDLGREKTNDHIDEWEDPAFEAYHKQDRYGFIQ